MSEQVQQAGAPTPNWDEAPEWATFWAMDATGAAFWYEREPEVYGGDGWVDGGRSVLAHQPGKDWRNSKQKRPQEATNE